jgi:hypothetical protein
MARFGCPKRIVIDNVASFKAEPLIQFVNILESH